MQVILKMIYLDLIVVHGVYHRSWKDAEDGGLSLRNLIRTSRIVLRLSVFLLCLFNVMALLCTVRCGPSPDGRGWDLVPSS